MGPSYFNGLDTEHRWYFCFAERVPEENGRPIYVEHHQGIRGVMEGEMKEGEMTGGEDEENREIEKEEERKMLNRIVIHYPREIKVERRKEVRVLLRWANNYDYWKINVYSEMDPSRSHFPNNGGEECFRSLEKLFLFDILYDSYSIFNNENKGLSFRMIDRIKIILLVLCSLKSTWSLMEQIRLVILL